MSEARFDPTSCDFDTLAAKIKSDELIQCDECNEYLIWDKIPDSNICYVDNHERFWGAPCSYRSVVAFICPECGKMTRF